MATQATFLHGAGETGRWVPLGSRVPAAWGSSRATDGGGAKRTPRGNRITKSSSGASLAAQWLGLHAPSAGGTGSIPGRGTKIPRAAQHGQKKKKENLFRNQLLNPFEACACLSQGTFLLRCLPADAREAPGTGDPAHSQLGRGPRARGGQVGEEGKAAGDEMGKKTNIHEAARARLPATSTRLHSASSRLGSRAATAGRAPAVREPRGRSVALWRVGKGSKDDPGEAGAEEMEVEERAGAGAGGVELTEP